MIFFVQDFNGKWAITTFIVRVITVIFSTLIVFLVIKLVTVSEDDDIDPTTILLIIASVACIGIDIYFALMYYYYWKYPELRVDRSGKGPQYELDEENGEDNPNPSQPFPLSNLYEFTYQSGDVNHEKSS